MVVRQRLLNLILTFVLRFSTRIVMMPERTGTRHDPRLFRISSTVINGSRYDIRTLTCNKANLLFFNFYYYVNSSKVYNTQNNTKLK